MLFSAGGVVASFFVPVMILITGIGLPLEMFGINDGIFDYTRIHNLVSHPVTRLFLFVLISMPLFHAAHRLRAVLIDVGLKSFKPLLSWLLYGGAIVGTVTCALILLRF